MRPDITVYGPGDHPILSAEVLTGVSPPDSHWAASFRSKLFEQGFEPTTKYFLMILPDKGFLWKNAGESETDPDFVFETHRFLEPFVGKRDLNRLSEQALIMAVYGWLDELTSSLDRAAKDKDSYNWLVESGLYELLKTNSSTILIEARY